MIKQRRELLAIYEKAGRTEQAAQEAAEIAVIEEFLPKQMSEAEAKEAIAAAIKETGAAGPKEMGKVMAALKARYAGRMDFGKASALVKELLGATRSATRTEHTRTRVGLLADLDPNSPPGVSSFRASRAAHRSAAPR